MSNIEYVNPLFKKVRSQLGAPIVDIELDDEQMSDLLENAHDVYHMLDESDKVERTTYFKQFWVKQYFIALCKEALGRIRGKFNGELNIPGTELTLSYKDLLAEAEKEKQFLNYLMLKDENVLMENRKPVLVFYVGVGNSEQGDIEYIMKKVEKSFKQEDGFIRYFIPVKEQESRIECVYPVSGVDDEVKKSISRMEEILKGLK